MLSSRMTTYWQYGPVPDPFEMLPDCGLLPCQWADMTTRDDLQPPEIRLMQAVLEDAIECAQYPDVRRYRNGACFATERTKARAWFRSDDTDHVFTFLRICEELHLDAEHVRRRVLGR